MVDVRQVLDYSFRFADDPLGTSPTSAGSHRPEHGLQQILFYLKLVRSARGDSGSGAERAQAGLV